MFLGHSAGRVALDLLSTLGGRRNERLVDAAALRDWLVAHGLVETSHRIDGDEVEQARALRTVLFAVVAAELSGDRPSDADIAALNAAAAMPQSSPRLRLGRDGLVQDRDQPSFVEILGVIARDAIELLTGPERELMRECAARDCRGVYVDTSPGRTRRWCSAARCGNRARVAAHRARRAGSTDVTDSTGSDASTAVDQDRLGL